MDRSCHVIGCSRSLGVGEKKQEKMTEKINLNSLVNSFLNASFGKKVAAGLLIIGIIISLGWAAQQGVNVSLNLDLQARLDYLAVQQQLLNDTINIPVNSTISAMVKTCSYIVSVHGSSYCLINGSDDRAGRLEYYSTNASQVINFAIGNGTGTVFCRKAVYNIDSLITIADGDALVFEHESEIKPTVDTDMFWVQSNGQLTGGFYNTTGISFSHSVIKIGEMEIHA